MSVFVCIFVSFDVSVPLDVLNVIDIPVDIEASDCFSVLVGIVDPVDVNFPVKTSFVDSLPVGFTVTIFVAFTVEDSVSVCLIVPVCASVDFVVSVPASVPVVLVAFKEVNVFDSGVGLLVITNVVSAPVDNPVPASVAVTVCISVSVCLFVCVCISVAVCIIVSVLNTLDIPVDVEAFDSGAVPVGILVPVEVNFPVTFSGVESLFVGSTVPISVAFLVVDSVPVISFVPACVRVGSNVFVLASAEDKVPASVAVAVGACVPVKLMIFLLHI